MKPVVGLFQIQHISCTWKQHEQGHIVTVFSTLHWVHFLVLPHPPHQFTPLTCVHEHTYISYHAISPAYINSISTHQFQIIFAFMQDFPAICMRLITCYQPVFYLFLSVCPVLGLITRSQTTSAPTLSVQLINIESSGCKFCWSYYVIWSLTYLWLSNCLLPGFGSSWSVNMWKTLLLHSCAGHHLEVISPGFALAMWDSSPGCSTRSCALGFFFVRLDVTV